MPPAMSHAMPHAMKVTAVETVRVEVRFSTL